MSFGRLALVGACSLVAAACSGASPRPPVGDLSAVAPAPTSLLRLARGGGAVRAYDARTLDQLEWSSESMPALAAVIGADADRRRILTVDAKRTLVALDLGSRRARVIGAGVAAAALGPDGTVWTMDTTLRLTAIGRRSTVRTVSALPRLPRAIYGTLSGRLLAVERGSNLLHTVGGSLPPVEQRLPDGAIATTMYGELMAVAADSGVVLYEPDRAAEPRFVGVNGRARTAIFSPSGHRLYVGTADEGILVLDRFSTQVRGLIDLPGAVSALRIDREGRWLLARPERSDSVWVVDLQTERAVASIAAEWESDLPAITAPGLVAVRWADDVVLINVGGTRPVEVGRVRGGAADVWLPVGWTPVRTPPSEEPAPTVAVAPDSLAPESLEARIDSALAEDPADFAAVAPAVGANPAQPSGIVYLQVSSSRNPAWVNTLAEQLKRQALPASVLSPALPDEPYRVVLGPYDSREAAEAAGRQIGMPSFVITVASPPSPR